MKLVSNEIILCPICGGSGTITNLERVSMYKLDYVNKICDYCNGERVVNKIIYHKIIERTGRIKLWEY